MKRLFVVLLACLLTILSCGSVSTAFAVEADVYSDVLADLQSDAEFDAGNYPYIPNNHSLQLITIAESSADELFVYVYQPSGAAVDDRASSINLSQGKGHTEVDGQRVPMLDFKVHSLTFVNSNGVFYKYKVDDFVIEDVRLREYEISAIYRPFIEGVDEPATGDNEISEVAFDVSKRFALGVENGQFVAYSTDIETIKITSKFVGFVRYTDTSLSPFVFLGKLSSCDAHFVAFDTDRQIDELLEADVFYRTQSYSDSMYSSAPSYGTITDNYIAVTNDDGVEFAESGWFGKTYSWQRIQTAEQFIQNVEGEDVYQGALFDVKVSDYKLTDSAKLELEDKQWVLCFAETSYTLSVFTSPNPTYIEYSTTVSDVSVLRLQFKTDGTVYNLGVVDNRQSGSKEPVNESDWGVDIDLNETGKKVMWIVIAVAIILLLLLVKPLASLVVGAIKFVCNVVYYVVVYPIKWFISLFTGKGGKR